MPVFRGVSRQFPRTPVVTVGVPTKSRENSGASKNPHANQEEFLRFSTVSRINDRGFPWTQLKIIVARG